MYVFGEIDNSSTVIESNVVSCTQNLTTSSIGIKSIIENHTMKYDEYTSPEYNNIEVGHKLLKNGIVD